MRERTVETRLASRVRAAGGQTVKLAPTTAGVPDRLVLLPHRPPLLVELKAPGGRLRPIQRAFHGKLAALGVPVAVLATPAEVDAWVAENV